MCTTLPSSISSSLGNNLKEYNENIDDSTLYFKTTEELDYSVNNYWPTIHFFLNDYDYKWKPQFYH